jgi:hypothetical protein
MNTFDRIRTAAAGRFAPIAIAAAVAAPAAFAPAAANAAATISQGFYQDQTIKLCSNASFCQIQFSAIPAGKTLIVRNIGCTFNASGTAPLLTLVMRSRLNGALTSRSNYMVQTYMGTSGGVRKWNSNNTALDIVLSGEVPEIAIGLGASASEFSGNCTISGELKP